MPSREPISRVDDGFEEPDDILGSDFLAGTFEPRFIVAHLRFQRFSPFETVFIKADTR